MAHSQSMKTLTYEKNGDKLYNSQKIQREHLAPLRISVLSTADPRFMSTQHHKTESDEHLSQLRQEALDRPTDFDAFLKLGDGYLEETEL